MKNPYLRLIRFDRPIGTLLLLWPTLWSIIIASNGHPPVYVIIVFSLGVFLTRSAGCAINDYADANFDKYVTRTKNRPLADGSLTKKQALITCLLLSIGAFILAMVTLKPMTILLSVPALIIFITYPFTKRFIAIPQAYLGLAYSFGLPMAFVEIQGQLPVLAFILFLSNLFWVIGYDTIYAMVDMEDDLKIGIRTSAITFGAKVVQIIAICYVLFILIMAYVGFQLHLKSSFWIINLFTIYLLTYQIKIISQDDKTKWFKMFLLNNRVGLVMFVSILLGYYY